MIVFGFFFEEMIFFSNKTHLESTYVEVKKGGEA